MSDDWQPGDLALCVAGGRLPDNTRDIPFPKGGAVFTVASVTRRRFVTGEELLALCIPDGPPNITNDHYWPALRFRKIRPHTPDSEDRETIALLTCAPVREPVA